MKTWDNSRQNKYATMHKKLITTCSDYKLQIIFYVNTTVVYIISTPHDKNVELYAP